MKHSKDFLKTIKEKARQNPARIVFAEGKEPRVLEAATLIKKESIAECILVEEPTQHPKFKAYAQVYADLREKSLEEAMQATANPHTFATLMVHCGDADGMIAGPTAPSKERILPALKIIKSHEKFHKVSGLFIMLLPEDTNEDAANGGVLFFADCAVNIEPDAHTLADIAIDSAESAKAFGLEPKIAMLSFSTEGSTQHPLVKKVQEASALVKERRPDLPISEDMQADAALMDAIGERKAPGSAIAGHANVLIFPNLEAGNIAYKLVERLADAKAIGPILQGLKKPVNELSRGCSAQDIVNLAAVTSLQAKSS